MEKLLVDGSNLTYRQQMALVLRMTEKSKTSEDTDSKQNNRPKRALRAVKRYDPREADAISNSKSVSLTSPKHKRDVKTPRKRPGAPRKRIVRRPVWRPSNYSAWSTAKKKMWNQLDSNPNRFYYHYTAPGETPISPSQDFSRAEARAFVFLLKHHPPCGKWGLFSMNLSGRTGLQCQKHADLLKTKGYLSEDFEVLSDLAITSFAETVAVVPVRSRTKRGVDSTERSSARKKRKVDDSEYTHSPSPRTPRTSSANTAGYFETPVNSNVAPLPASPPTPRSPMTPFTPVNPKTPQDPLSPLTPFQRTPGAKARHEQDAHFIHPPSPPSSPELSPSPSPARTAAPYSKSRRALNPDALLGLIRSPKKVSNNQLKHASAASTPGLYRGVDRRHDGRNRRLEVNEQYPFLPHRLQRSAVRPRPRQPFAITRTQAHKHAEQEKKLQTWLNKWNTQSAHQPERAHQPNRSSKPSCNAEAQGIFEAFSVQKQRLDRQLELSTTRQKVREGEISLHDGVQYLYRTWALNPPPNASYIDNSSSEFMIRKIHKEDTRSLEVLQEIQLDCYRQLNSAGLV